MWGDYIGDGLVRQFVRLTGVKYRDFFLLIIEKEKISFRNGLGSKSLVKQKQAFHKNDRPHQRAVVFRFGLSRRWLFAYLVPAGKISVLSSVEFDWNI